MNIPETYFRQAQIFAPTAPQSPTVAQNNTCAWMCADRAARVFAPAALDRIGSHVLADRLRNGPPVVGKEAAAEMKRIIGPVSPASILALREAARACEHRHTHEMRALSAGRLACEDWEAAIGLAYSMHNVCAELNVCPMCGRDRTSAPWCGVCGTLLL